MRGESGNRLDPALGAKYEAEALPSLKEHLGRCWESSGRDHETYQRHLQRTILEVIVALGGACAAVDPSVRSMRRSEFVAEVLDAMRKHCEAIERQQARIDEMKRKMT